MIAFSLKGNFNKTNKFFRGSQQKLQSKIQAVFKKYAEQGLVALKNMTPKKTGLTASKWTYHINKNGIVYENSNVVNRYHVVLLLQYGHATKNGGYVQGLDFINPAITPIFNKIVEECWKEVMAL